MFPFLASKFHPSYHLEVCNLDPPPYAMFNLDPCPRCNVASEDQPLCKKCGLCYRCKDYQAYWSMFVNYYLKDAVQRYRRRKDSQYACERRMVLMKPVQLKKFFLIELDQVHREVDMYMAYETLLFRIYNMEGVLGHIFSFLRSPHDGRFMRCVKCERWDSLSRTSTCERCETYDYFYYRKLASYMTRLFNPYYPLTQL